jgi:Zn-dependent peptidase ImmA (M78 family)
MDLTHYKPTALEEFICKRYHSYNIQYSSDMDIEVIADLFNIEVRYIQDESFADCKDGMPALIFIDARLHKIDRRADFFHELGHCLLHCGNQDYMPELFKELQEIQTGHFQRYAAMPYYMLSEFQYVSPSLLVKTMAEEFMLPEKFVEYRLEQVKRRIYIGTKDHEVNTRWNTPVKVTKEDIRQVLEEFTRRKMERERAY